MLAVGRVDLPNGHCPEPLPAGRDGIAFEQQAMLIDKCSFRLFRRPRRADHPGPATRTSERSVSAGEPPHLDLPDAEHDGIALLVAVTRWSAWLSQAIVGSATGRWARTWCGTGAHA